MVEEKVIELTKAFAAYWNAQLANYPRYQLDLSWPSVGAVELILSPLRGEKDFGVIQEGMILGASAYLGTLAHDCWTVSIASPEVELKFEAGESPGVVIEAKNTSELPNGEIFRVEITRVLREILSEPQNPFPYFSEFSRLLAPGEGVVRLFALGLFSGLCPYGEGHWSSLEVAEGRAICTGAQSYLALSAAKSYKRLHPGELHGADCDLYVNNLVLPPFGTVERFPGLLAAEGVLKYCTENRLDPDRQRRLASNLCLSTDELISLSGLILAQATSSVSPSNRLLINAEHHGPKLRLLRPAVGVLREGLGGVSNWFDLLDNEQVEEAIALARLEKSQGLLPLLRLDPELLRDKRLRKLFFLLAWSQPGPALLEISELREHGVTSAELELQQVALGIELGDLEEAANHLKRLDMSSMNLAARASVFELAARISRAKKNYAETVRQLRRGVELAGEADEKFGGLSIALLELLVLTEEHQEGLALAERLYELGRRSLSLLINRTLLKVALQQPDAKEALDELLRFAPADECTFRLMLSLEIENAESAEAT